MRVIYAAKSLFFMGILSSVNSEKSQCLQGLPGDSGPQTDRQGPNGEISFQRAGGNNCACSYAEAKCEVVDTRYPNGDCNSLTIDGRVAAKSGYPEVKIKHTLKACNYNRNAMKLIAKRPTKLELFYPGEDKSFDTMKEFDTQDLSPGDCLNDVTITNVSTSKAKYFMRATVEGPQITNEGSRVNDGNCYAYAFNTIQFKYDYGFGDCKVHTELDCVVDGTDTPCDTYIGSLTPGECTPFEGVFTAKACNDNNRDIQIQKGASNYKINTYDRKGPNQTGAYKREKFSLPTQLDAKKCAEFETRKPVDPCKENFYQIKVQGEYFNKLAENDYFFKDKDCESFSFGTLPLLQSITLPTLAPAYQEGRSGKGRKVAPEGRKKMAPKGRNKASPKRRN